MRTCSRCQKVKSDSQFKGNTRVCNHCAAFTPPKNHSNTYVTKASLGPVREPSKINANYICPEVE